MDFSTTDLFFLLLTVLLVYLFTKWRGNKFDCYGIKYVKPVPFVGNVGSVFMGKVHVNETLQKVYKEFPDQQYIGFYNFGQKVVLVKDPEMIKRVTIKDFEHFFDHREILDEVQDPLFASNLFNLRGKRWHEMRSALSPAFTSSRMRDMMPFMEEVAQRFVAYLDERLKDPSAREKGFYEVEMKQLMTKCGNDIIASCAFGVKEDSLTNDKNEFYMKSHELTNLDGVALLKMAGYQTVPWVMKWLNISVMGESVKEFFGKLVSELMEYRKRTGEVRHDMIHLLMKVMDGSLEAEAAQEGDSPDTAETYTYKTSKKNNTIWSQDQITGQAIGFLFAGFDTTSTLLSFLIMELVSNPDKQQKVVEEVDTFIKENGRMVNYSDLAKLTYLDMALNETLRLWPPAGTIDRVCTKPYDLPPNKGNTKPYRVEKGDFLWIPAWAIHRDSQYYPEPEKFIPERFSEENKASINPSTYLPFGSGPRICIGSRFALMEIKIIAFYLLANFDLVKTSKTVYPVIKSHFFLLHAKDGIWVGLKRRDIKH